MPQGRAELHDRFGDDWTAWKLLERHGWTQDRFVLKEPDGKPWGDCSQEEKDAVEYLVTEWDWA